MLSIETVRILNNFLYPVICERNIMDGVDWVIETCLKCDQPVATTDEAIKAIDEVVSTSGWLNEIASRGNHSESDIKKFLLALKAAISK